MSNALHLFIKSSFFSYAGKIARLLFGIIYVYLIANYFGPEQYGSVSYLLNLAGLIALLVGNEAISETINVFTAKTKSTKVFTTLLKVQIALAIASFLLFLVLGPLFIGATEKASVELTLWASGIVLLSPASFLFPALFGGLKQFGKVLKLSFLESLINLLLAIAFVFLWPLGLLGIILAKIGSLTIFTWAAWAYFKKTTVQEIPIDTQEIKKYLINSIKFNFLKKGQTQINVLLFGIFVQTTSLGFYYLVEKISTNFIEMPLNALNEVMLTFASEKGTDTKVLENYISFLLKLSLGVAVLFSISLGLLGPILITVLFPAFAGGIVLIPFFILINLTTAFRPLTIIFKSTNQVQVLTQGYTITILFTLIGGSIAGIMYGLAGILGISALSNALFFGFLYWNVKKMKFKLKIVPAKSDWTFLINHFKQAKKE
ncbi:MAG: oligosaccharide flippase family protein [Candidatus Diapherotrites archaeon]|nr:oligosaccharide flippase family protein [Candidatus Diapherotrites archaeon]